LRVLEVDEILDQVPVIGILDIGKKAKLAGFVVRIFYFQPPAFKMAA
jgi:hypothetical protein